MVKLRGSRKIGDRIRQVTDSERRREILSRGLIVEKDTLSLARKTALTDAAFWDSRTSKRVILHGGLYDAVYGKEKAKRDAIYGTEQEKKTAPHRLRFFEQLYQEMLLSNKKSSRPLSPEIIKQINEQAKRDVYAAGKIETPYEKAKERMRKKLGYSENK